MVTYITDAYSIEYRGLSTDNKPMSVQKWGCVL